MDGVYYQGQARSARELCGILGYINKASGKVSFRFFFFFLFFFSLAPDTGTDRKR